MTGLAIGCGYLGGCWVLSSLNQGTSLEWIVNTFGFPAKACLDEVVAYLLRSDSWEGRGRWECLRELSAIWAEDQRSARSAK